MATTTKTTKKRPVKKPAAKTKKVVKAAANPASEPEILMLTALFTSLTLIFLILAIVKY